MKLVVNELHTSIYQEITASEDTQIGAIRPHLYKHNSPIGNVQLEIQDLYGNTLATSSNSITITDISASAFFHGKIRFYITYKMKADTTYRITLVGTDGYSFDESAWVGWCNDYDLSCYSRDYTVSSGINAPLLMEIWALEKNEN